MIKSLPEHLNISDRGSRAHMHIKHTSTIATVLTMLFALCLAHPAQAGAVKKGLKATERGVKKGVDVTVGGTKKGLKETEGGVKKAVRVTEGGVKKGIKETDGGIKKGVKETKKFLNKVF